MDSSIHIEPKRTWLRVERVRGRSEVTGLSGGGGPLRVRILASGTPVATVAVSQAEACLLSGDELEFIVELGQGALLEITEIGAMIAHATRQGPGSRICFHGDLGPDARLSWKAEPFIFAAGCSVDRQTDLNLSGGSIALLEETLVFGRHGEEHGRFTSQTRASIDGEALFDDRLASGPTLRSATGIGEHNRAFTSVALLGMRDPVPSAETMGLFGPGSVARFLALEGADCQARSSEVWSKWKSLVFE